MYYWVRILYYQVFNRGDLVLPGTQFVLLGKDLVLPGTHFVLLGKDLVIRGTHFVLLANDSCTARSSTAVILYYPVLTLY